MRRTSVGRTLLELVRRRSGASDRSWILRHVGTGAARVGIISDHGSSDLAAYISARRPQAFVVDVARSTDPWERHLRLVDQGLYDLVIVDTEADEHRFGLLQDLFFLVKSNGKAVVRGGRTGPADGFADLLKTIMAAHRGELKASRNFPPSRQGDLIRMGRGVRSLEDDGDHVVLTRGRNLSLAKLNEHGMNEYLRRRASGRDRLVATLPSETFRSRAVLHHNAASRPKHLREDFDVPELSLRLYRDVAVGPGQVAVTDGLVLPDTYRHNTPPRLVNRYVVDLAPRFARPRFSVDELSDLDGTFFYLDSEFRGHFGHLLTEQASRLWAWPRVKEAHPEAKVLMATAIRRPEVQEFEYVFLEAAGVAREDVVLIKEPVRVDSLYGATPMMQNPVYVHPRMREIWQQIGDTLASKATPLARPKRIFVSRTITKRACHNQAEVEELFTHRGFEIVLPETLSMPDQVQLFRSAETIAGFAGSGLFNIALADSPKRVISVGSERYLAANEYIMASVWGHELTQVTCVPDDPTNFQSDYSFDFEREGPFLQGVLDSLD